MARQDLQMDEDFDANEDDRSPVLRRAPRIREDEVYQIADRLLLEGHRPSVERIRVQLGRGSPNTIAVFLDRWWSRLGARLRDLPGQELPAVPPEVANAMLTLWTGAIDHARTLLHDTLAQQSAALAAEREQLEQRTTELERKQEELHREREALQQTVAMAQSQLTEANERHRLDTARLGDTQNELARTMMQVEALRADTQALTAKLEAALQQHQSDVRALNERNEVTERHWLKEVDEARQAWATERKHALVAERQHSADTAKRVEELREVNTKVITMKAELDRARDAQAETKTQIAKVEKAMAEQGVRADRTVQALQESQAQSTRQIDALQLQLRDALEELKQAHARNEVLQRAATSARETGKGHKPGR